MDTLPTTPLKTRSWGAFLLIAIVLIAASGILLYRLGYQSFQDYDEATYAEVTSEGLAAHSYISFTFLHLDYFNKPPLLFWMMDVSKSIIPNQEVGARIPSALAGIFTVGIVILLMYMVTGSGYGAAFGGAILATTSAFMEPARQVRFDNLASLFIMLAVYAFLRAMENRRWFLWYGAFIGLAVLTKGPLAIYAIIPSLAIALVYWDYKWFINKYFWGGVGIALIIVLPWHIYETILYGYTFWDTYLFDQLVQRVAENLFSTGPTNAEYLEYLFEFAAPWAPIACLSLFGTPFLWKKMTVKTRAAVVASFVGIASVLAICFYTKTKAFSYLIPLYPFMATAIGLVLCEIWKLRIPGSKTFLIALFACLLAMASYLVVFNAFHLNPYFTEEDQFAFEEKAIGEFIRTDHITSYKTFDVTTLGSIMYYSGIVSPAGIYKDTVVAPGTIVLYQTSETSKLEARFPNDKLTVLYSGTSLSVATLAT